MDYRSVADLNTDVRRLAWDLPSDVDSVVGVGRGGRLAATLLQQTTGLPVVDCGDEGGICVDGVEAGDTLLVLADVLEADEEDVAAGVRTRLDGVAAPVDIRRGAVYVAEGVGEGPDYWVDVVETPCAFEWDVLDPQSLENACVDIDGVLCRDPTPEENDDGPNYREFLTTVEPQMIPDGRVGWLVTCRLEQYRPETEQWLDDHGVEYDELVMWDLPSKAVRDERGGHGRYKAEVYERTGAETFVESSLHQALVIAREAEKPVYCFDENQVIPPGEAAEAYGPDPYLVRLAEDPRSFLLAASRYVASKGVSTVSQTAGVLR